MAVKKAGSGRTRNYATVIYPDSENTPENWKSVLADQCIPAFISPLHDLDTNPTGEVKKAHWHVMIMFEGPKTMDQAKSVFDLIGGVGCEVVNSLRGYARYLCHLDNPEKYQYNTEDVIALAGADYAASIGLPTDKYNCIREMMQYCVDNQVTAYSDLLMYASLNRYDWFRVLCDSGTVVMKEFLKSESWKFREALQSERNDKFVEKVAKYTAEMEAMKKTPPPEDV